MNRFMIGGAVAALSIASVAAFAQPAPPTPPGVASGTAPMPLPAPRDGQQVRMIMTTDHVMTRDEVVSHVRALFAHLDANRDGFITREELDGARDRMVGMGDRVREIHTNVEQRLADRGVFIGDRGAMFDRLDTNHDGMISRGEFMAGRSHAREERVMIMRDGAGRPGAPGMPRMPGAPGMPGMMGMHMHGMGMGFGGHLFDMADANHDGRVSLQEAQAAALAHFDRADLNHDGRITPDERMQMRKEVRIERRQG
jgi:hypothetical protein